MGVSRSVSQALSKQRATWNCGPKGGWARAFDNSHRSPMESHYFLRPLELGTMCSAGAGYKAVGVQGSLQHKLPVDEIWQTEICCWASPAREIDAIPSP